MRIVAVGGRPRRCPFGPSPVGAVRTAVRRARLARRVEDRRDLLLVAPAPRRAAPWRLTVPAAEQRRSPDRRDARAPTSSEAVRLRPIGTARRAAAGGGTSSGWAAARRRRPARRSASDRRASRSAAAAAMIRSSERRRRLDQRAGRPAAPARRRRARRTRRAARRTSQVLADGGHLGLGRARPGRTTAARSRTSSWVSLRPAAGRRVGHGDSTCRIASRPSRIRLLTVPSGVPVRSAISTWVSPPK